MMWSVVQHQLYSPSIWNHPDVVMTCHAGMPCRLHSVHDEEKPFELEISWISDATGREFQRVPEDVLQAAEQAAKAALEESDMYAHEPLVCSSSEGRL